MTGTVLLAARDLKKSYRRGPEEVHALDGVSLELHPGEMVALVGPSGSGKTTLLNIIVGWEAPDAGELVWAGASVGFSAAELPWSELAIVPQSLGLIEELSVAENVGWPLRLGQAPPDDAPDPAALIDELGLGELADRAPGELSLGEQQRCALARGLACGPRLVLADEPTGHQDAESTKLVMRLLREAAERGTAALVATHNHEILKYMDRILGIRDGRLTLVPVPEAGEGA